MNHPTQVLCRRNVRAYISAIITYLMLVGQVAPLALAASGPAPRPAPKSETTATQPESLRAAPAPLFAAPAITATKVDAYPSHPSGKADPGDTITYTVTVTNTGSADATGVTFTDSVDTNTTLVAGSITTTPIANDETVTAFGNVRISTANGAPNLLANDCDPDPAGGPCTNTGLTASGPTTSTNGGNVVVNSDGTFSYNPAPGYTGSDSFTYTVTDPSSKTDTATVNITVGPTLIWFINNDPGAPAGNDGRITSPFNSIAAYNASAPSKDPNDIIFIYQGTSAYTGNLTLTSGMKLIGQGFALQTETGAPPTGSDALPGATAKPTINSAAGNTVTLNTNNTIRGLTLNDSAGIDITGSSIGTLTVSAVTLSGTGRPLNLSTGALAATFDQITSTSSSGGQAINLAGLSGTMTVTNGTSITNPTTQCILVGTTTANIDFGNTSCSGGTDGVSFQNNSGGTRTFGTLGVSGGTGNAFLHGTGGGNVTINGAATLASASNVIDIQTAGAAVINFAGGATVTKTTAGGAGVNLVASSVTFQSLGITTSNGTGLSAVTSGTVTVTNGTKAISATGSAGQAAPAIIANGITLNANFSSVTSTNSGNGAAGTGISLTAVAGTSNFGTGSITGASGVSFFVNGGAASVTYNGTLTQTTAARVIDIQNKTGSGTMAFGGAITSNNGTGQGVFLNANASTTFTFTAGLNLSTATNDAFTATSSGTVSATQNNTSIVNTLTTTTGQALKVTSTTIGASGLTFRSITANGGTNNGVTLDTTGAGFFTITGNGTVASGGTIQNKNGADNSSATQGTGIYLNAVAGAVSLTRMDIQGCQNYGIRGIGVTGGFTLDNSTVGTTAKNGTSVTADPDADTTTQGECSVRFLNLTGTVAFSNDSFDNGFTRTIFLHNNTAGSTLNLTITNSTLRQSLNNSNGGDPGGGSTDAMFMQANSTATMNLNMSGSHVTAYRQFGILTDARDAATMNIDIGTCDFSNNNTGNVNASSGLNFGGSGSPSNDVFVHYNVHNNTFRHGSASGTPTNGGAQIVSGGVSGGVKMDGKILNNTMGVSGVVGSGAGNAADVLRLFATGNNAASTRISGSTHTRYLVQGNTIQRYGEAGIQINARQGNSTIDATVLGNIIREPGTAALGAFAAIWVNSGALAADTNQVNIGIGSATVAADKNTMQDSDPSNATDVFLDKNTCAGCASTLNIYQNGSDAAGATTEAKVRDVLVDDNNPTLDLLAGFTNASAIGFIAGLPPQPSGPVSFDDTSAGPGGVGVQIDSATAPQTAPAPSVTARPAAAAPRTTVAPKAVAPAAKRDGGTTFRHTAEDSSAPLNPAPEPTAQRRKVLAPVLTDAPGGPNGAGGSMSIIIGTLTPGASVTITFQVVVDNPYSGGPNVSNQGTVSGSNFSNVLTDDTAVGGAADPTLTPINNTDIRVNDASVAEPNSGTAQMLFTLTLSQPAPGGGLSVNYATANGGATPATGGASCGGTVDYVTAAGTFLISELRTSGPGGLGDDFVEFYNNTNSPLTVASSDASAGYGLYKMGATCNDTPVLIATIPNGTIIPARGHYLAVGSQYTLANYGGTGAAAGNQTLTSDIESDRNVAVFSTATVANISSANRLDAVGGDSNAGAVCDLLREGNNLPATSGSTTEHSFFRKLCDFGVTCTGDPKDTNDNAADFRFADTQGTFISGVTQRLGAPGPENLSSPIRRDTSGIGMALLDGSVASSAHPNRTRSFTSNPAQNSTFGTLIVRRRVTNSTGANVTRLRYRIIEMSTFPSPGGGVADLRAITSVDEPGVGPINDATTCANGGTPATPPCTVTARGTTLEQPPNQPNGGGINSSLSSGTVTLATPLANNASLNMRFVLGIQTTGTYRFFIIIEALP